MFFFRTKELLRYILLSSHRKGQGIHSPFVFDVVSRVFRNKIDEAVVSKVEGIRKELIRVENVIMVDDLGAGTVKYRSEGNRRRVSDIARYSSIPKKYGILLANLAKEYGGQSIIELGTSLGISSMYMAYSCPESEIHTIEGCRETAKIAEKNIKSAAIDNITVHCGSFEDYLPSVLDSTNTPGLVFIDGNHRKEAVLRYFDIVAEKSDSGSVVVLDDIYLSPEMKDAWKKVRKHRKVTVTIDIHRFGIAFFRKGINSNHFVVRL